MDDSARHRHENHDIEPEAFSGIYQPRRGLLAKTVAVVILVVLVLVPLVLALATIHRWDPAPRPEPSSPEATSSMPQ